VTGVDLRAVHVILLINAQDAKMGIVRIVTLKDLAEDVFEHISH